MIGTQRRRIGTQGRRIILAVVGRENPVRKQKRENPVRKQKRENPVRKKQRENPVNHVNLKRDGEEDN
jgi:hypothetical protein